jgi:hypothetical protein
VSLNNEIFSQPLKTAAGPSFFSPQTGIHAIFFVIVGFAGTA